jgi:hypothetical protein
MILYRRGKIFVAAIIVGAIIVFTAMYIGANQQAAILEEDVGIDLKDVRFKSFDAENNIIILEVTFEFSNNSDTVMTVGEVVYDLLADDNFVCKGGKSYRDIPLIGRPQIFAFGVSGPVRTECEVTKNNVSEDIWNAILNNNMDDYTWRTQGRTEVETSISVIIKEFDLWI